MIKNLRHTGSVLPGTAAVFCTLAISASAQVPGPEGCEPRVTVEKNGCVATTVFDCGSHFEEHGYVDGRLVDTHRFARNWAFAGYSFLDGRQQVEVNFDHGRSITLKELANAGTATTDRSVLMSTGRMKGREFHLTATADLTGEQTELSGHNFQNVALRRQFDLVSGTNSLIYEFEALLSTDLDLFIEGSHSRQTAGSDPEFLDQTPVALHFPGDPGFLSAKLEAGCDD